MSDKSGIEWTDATWNPTTGCTKVSPGCARCYIERTPPFRIAKRRFERGAIPLVLHSDRIPLPLHWKRPRRIFVNSLSDLFHNDVPDAFIGAVFATMAEAHWHTFQVLTKRVERLVDWSRGVAYYPRGDRSARPLPGWPPHVWIGASVENQHFADVRIPRLLQVQAAVRFISAEPLLAPLDLRPYLPPARPALGWVVVGGETGPGARPCGVDSIRAIVMQCRAAGVPVFVKQLGTHVTAPEQDPCRRAHLRDGGSIAPEPDGLRVRLLRYGVSETPADRADPRATREYPAR